MYPVSVVTLFWVTLCWRFSFHTSRICAVQRQMFYITAVFRYKGNGPVLVFFLPIGQKLKTDLQYVSLFERTVAVNHISAKAMFSRFWSFVWNMCRYIKLILPQQPVSSRLTLCSWNNVRHRKELLCYLVKAQGASATMAKHGCCKRKTFYP